MSSSRPAGMSDDESTDEEKTYFSSSYSSPKNGSDDRSSMRSNIGTNGRPASGNYASSSGVDRSHREERELQLRAMGACTSGDLEVIDNYIKAGHDVDEYLYTGWTLLLYGASSVLPEVIELLLNHGAKPDKDRDGYTPLMALCDSTRGTEERCLECIDVLLNAKADPNTRNKDMKTPLMFACGSRGSTVVAELLKHVENIDATDSDGQTALHYAAAANKPETVELLLANNASSAIIDHFDFTANDIAVTKGFDKIVSLLDFENGREIEAACCRVSQRNTWSDMFPEICGVNAQLLDNDIAEILYGMSLEYYKPLFKGVELKTFVKLTDEDLVKFGMDVALHRKFFFNNLHKFHTKAWSIKSIGSFKTHLPYTLYDGVALLGNAARQIRIIGSSFEFIKNGLRRASSRGIDGNLTDVQRACYNEELQRTEKILLPLKNDLRNVLTLAKKAEKDNPNIVSAEYIGRQERKHNLMIVVTVIITTGMYLSTGSFVQRLWNN